MRDEATVEDSVIWRYMDLERFVIMLVSGRLRYTKAAEFRDDPWEGFCKVALPNITLPKPDLHGAVRLESAEQFAAALLESSSRLLLEAHERLYVNSWSLRADSMAMWKIYGANGRGVAIRSSIRRCKAALRFDVSSDHYDFGPVAYSNDIAASPQSTEDFSNGGPIPGPDLWKRITAKAFMKRSAYEHEGEWRGALYQDHRPDITGVDVSCDFETLIDSVIVGPYAPEFMVGVIEDLMGKFGIQTSVLRSDLLSAPPAERIVRV